MMSVLIRGVEMPTSCDDCILTNGITCYAVPEYKEDGVVGRTDDRPNWCPLVEIPPHGDLIDRKALLADTTDMIHSMMVFGGARVYTSDAIKNAHTIIPAEEGR